MSRVSDPCSSSGLVRFFEVGVYNRVDRTNFWVLLQRVKLLVIPDIVASHPRVGLVDKGVTVDSRRHEFA